MGEIRRTVVAALPAAAAILVFGVIYGSFARPEMGALATILSSLLIFSGAVQFTVAALLASGAGVLALLAGASALNLRNLVLAAVLRPHVDRRRGSRGVIAWFLTDEATGLALALGGDASTVVVVAGGIFYLSWQLGTVLGVLGASVGTLRDAATAVFPVLFVGLAAVTCTSWSVTVRALVAAVAAGLASWLLPGSKGVAAVLAAIVVAAVGGDE